MRATHGPAGVPVFCEAHANGSPRLGDALDLAVVEGLRLRAADAEARLAATEAALGAERERSHSLANRCSRAELTLEALVEWADAHIKGVVVLDEIIEEARGVLAARKKVDHPGRDDGGVAVDGGGEAGGRASAPPGLRDLVEEYRDLAIALLDAGKCPECGGGECGECDGFGFVDTGEATPDCPICKGYGNAPHVDGCRLATARVRLDAALGGAPGGMF